MQEVRLYMGDMGLAGVATYLDFGVKEGPVVRRPLGGVLDTWDPPDTPWTPWTPLHPPPLTLAFSSFLP